jgi:hypothetical protein
MEIKIKSNKSTISSFKLIQAYEYKLHFDLTCPYTSEHLSSRHRNAYIKGVDWCFMHNFKNISLQSLPTLYWVMQRAQFKKQTTKMDGNNTLFY